MYTSGLTAAGFRVVRVDDEDAASAALTIAALKPDAVITRVCPDLFGIDLTRRLRKFRSLTRTPVVLLTTHSDDATHNLACAAGATAIYMLPLVPTALARTLGMLTDHQHA